MECPLFMPDGRRYDNIWKLIRKNGIKKFFEFRRFLKRKKKQTSQEDNILRLHAPFKPTGDQPQAIETLVKGFKEGNQFQALLGVTG